MNKPFGCVLLDRWVFRIKGGLGGALSTVSTGKSQTRNPNHKQKAERICAQYFFDKCYNKGGYVWWDRFASKQAGTPARSLLRERTDRWLDLWTLIGQGTGRNSTRGGVGISNHGREQSLGHRI